LAVNDTFVFWTTADFFVRAIRKDRSGAIVDIASSEATPFGITADSQTVYWTNRGNGTIRAARCQN
jgi:hypothetical protein